MVIIERSLPGIIPKKATDGFLHPREEERSPRALADAPSHPVFFWSRPRTNRGCAMPLRSSTTSAQRVIAISV